MKKEAISSSETSVYIYHSTMRSAQQVLDFKITRYPKKQNASLQIEYFLIFRKKGIFVFGVGPSLRTSAITCPHFMHQQLHKHIVRKTSCCRGHRQHLLQSAQRCELRRTSLFTEYTQIYFSITYRNAKHYIYIC